MNPTIRLAASGNIAVEIPSVLAEGRSHVVEIPMTLAGLSVIKKILVERALDRSPSLGKASAPVASQINAFLAKREAEDRAAARKQSEEFASRYNIELEL
jgi:hypothetical protein